MNTIHIVGNSTLYMNLLEQDLETIGKEINISKFDFDEYPNEGERTPHYAFIFYDKRNDSPLVAAEQIRKQYPQCCIIFVHTLPDSSTFSTFKKSNIFQVSLPCTAEELNRIVRDASNPQYFERHCKAVDDLIYQKLKRYIRLV